MESPSLGLLTELKAFVVREVRAAFAPIDDIVESAVEAVLEDEADRVWLRAAADRYLAEAVREHAEAQKAFPDVTDCDRLDAAFEALESEGVVARQNFTCCQTCGHAEIRAEVAALSDSGRAIRGYAFYHQQDTDRAVDGDGLYLAFGATEKGDDAEATVGGAIARCLWVHGLAVVWNGSHDQRIWARVHWERRRG
jgi:Domain of unknown function (DUF6891)